MPVSPRFLAAAASALAVLLLSGPRLGHDPFLPEEVQDVLALPSPFDLAAGPGLPGDLAPESWARLPSLLLAAAAALLLSLAAPRGRSAGAPLLVALHPAVHAAARTASPAALALFLVSAACLARERGGRAARILAGALAALAALTVAAGLSRPEEGTLGLAAGAWGLVLGEGIPPWRLDLVVPALAVLLPLAWLGLGSTWLPRSLRLLALVAGAALLGLFAGRPLSATTAAAPLVPLLLLAVARGAVRLEGLARTGAMGVGITVGLVGVADLHLGRDVLDPARRVPWDEAARMTAVLAVPDAVLVAAPDLPAPLALYARELARAEGPAEVAESSLTAASRVVVVSHGIRGGLDWPSTSIEERLERSGFRLAGELSFGALEAGLARLLPRFTGVEAPAAYLRVRRYER